MAIIKLTRNIIRSINPFNKLIIKFILLDKSIIKTRSLKYYSDKIKNLKFSFNEFMFYNATLVEKSYFVSYYNELNNGHNNHYSHFKSMRELKSEENRF